MYNSKHLVSVSANIICAIMLRWLLLARIVYVIYVFICFLSVFLLNYVFFISLLLNFMSKGRSNGYFYLYNTKSYYMSSDVVKEFVFNIPWG